MHLLHLPSGTSQLSPAFLKCAQNTDISLQLGKQSLFYNEVLNVSCNLLGTALNLKNTVAVWVQDGWKCAGFQPQDRGAASGVAAAARHHKRGSDPLSPAREKIPTQSLKCAVPAACTSGSQRREVGNPKLNHELGTVRGWS